jgi:chromosome partitioning protein
MSVITLANTKGGSGKTTAALLLATEYARQGYRVTLLDGDPQQWFTQWAERGGACKNLEIISEVTPISLQCHIREMKHKTDYFVIDLPGARDALLATALGLSDHVLIPVQGCAMDARGAAQVLELLEQLKTECGIDIAHSVVLTRVNALVTTRTLNGIKQVLQARGVNVLDTPIYERTAFRDVFEHGETLYNATNAKISNLDKAKENSRSLAMELKKFLPRNVRSSGRSNVLSWRRKAA